MTPAGELLAAEIRRDGPIPFRRFMEVALYHPEHGYYRRPRDPFGKAGRLLHGRADPAGLRHPDGGAHPPALPRDGRAARISRWSNWARAGGEMAEAFSEWRYVPVDIDCGELPESFRGVVFSNEFFDALPVDVAVFRDGAFREQRVALRRTDASSGETAATVAPEVERLPARATSRRPKKAAGTKRTSTRSRGWSASRARCEAGYVLTIDYGYTRAESVRFPAGTLMGYRRHTAREDVLEDPGERDITAHVNFTALEECGARVRTAHRTFRDAGADACSPPAKPISSPPRSARRSGGRAAPPHAAQDAAVRHGRDVSGAAAEAGEAEGRRTGGKSLKQ